MQVRVRVRVRVQPPDEQRLHRSLRCQSSHCLPPTLASPATPGGAPPPPPPPPPPHTQTMRCAPGPLTTPAGRPRTQVGARMPAGEGRGLPTLVYSVASRLLSPAPSPSHRLCVRARVLLQWKQRRRRSSGTTQRAAGGQSAWRQVCKCGVQQRPARAAPLPYLLSIPLVAGVAVLDCIFP